MFRIGYRTLKTAVGVAIAIMIAQSLGLTNYVSAGILTILCIQVTKKKSLRASWDRFIACIVAMVLSPILFEMIAYHPIVIGVLLLLFIPIVVALKASDGIVTSSVIILHLYSAQQISQEIIINELGIIIIGIGVALIMNLYMPSVDKQLVSYQEKIEMNFRRIFHEIVLYLREGNTDWDGREITETNNFIAEAKTLAFRDVENHFMRHENSYYLYFKMREKQFEIIERVLPIITSIPYTLEQGEIIADFIDELKDNIHPGNTAMLYLKKLYDLKIELENMELPQTREEFEARAALLHFLKEMELYLIIKRSFKGLKKQEQKYEKKLIEPN